MATAGSSTMMINRRMVLLGTSAVAACAFLSSTSASRAAAKFAVTHTEDEWRALLTPEQYSVLREAGTEYPFTSPLNTEHRKGVFACAGCERDLFSSDTKFDSGTGWPSFWK